MNNNFDDDFRMGVDGDYFYHLRLAEPDKKGISNGKIHFLLIKRKGRDIALFRGNDWEMYPYPGPNFEENLDFIRKVIDQFN